MLNNLNVLIYIYCYYSYYNSYKKMIYIIICIIIMLSTNGYSISKASLKPEEIEKLKGADDEAKS